MSTYFLRLEGTNFDAFLSDTQDLSTIRGGGLALLGLPDQVADLGDGPALRRLGSGASSGLFSFEAEGDGAAAAVCDQVRRRLRENPALAHATVAVDVLRAGEDFQRDGEALRALNRWRQLSSPSLAVPSPVTGAEPCVLDRLRPAGGEHRHADGAISESVHRRRELGRDRKQRFYRDETGIDVEAGFSNDLEHLTDDESRGNVHGKMAVVYLDGNAFGDVSRRHSGSSESRGRLDAHLRALRRDALRDLVEGASGRPALREPDGRLRLETLLWGGDEIVWVVPAWAGWWAVETFFDRPWSYEGEDLHHACGVVFCHHKAPIHRMRRLAEELAGLAKDKDRGADLVAYEVLESYDDVGEDLAGFRRRRCPPGVEPGELILPPERISRAQRLTARLRSAWPARQVHAAARATLTRRETVDDPGVRSALAAEDHAVLDELLASLGSPKRRDLAWLHLVELADYLEPLTEVEAEP